MIRDLLATMLLGILFGWLVGMGLGGTLRWTYDGHEHTLKIGHSQEK